MSRASGRDGDDGKAINLALQGGGSHGAYAWGVLDALIEDDRIEIGAISGASAGAFNAVIYAAGLAEGGRKGAREKLEKFWLSVSTEGSLAPAQRKLIDAWLQPLGVVWPGTGFLGAWAEAMAQFASPYALNPFNFNPLRHHLAALVDFGRLRAYETPKLFVAATNVKTGRGEIFRRDVLTADHVMASGCLPQLFRAVRIGDDFYWDGGYAGNPPLWPLFYETACRDVIIVQINPIERADVPRTPEDIMNRLNEITFNASLLGELRAADFVARLIRSGVLQSQSYRLERLHRIGGAGKLERFPASTKFDVSWPFLLRLRDLGRADARAWLEAHYDSIGVESTLDIDETLKREPAKLPVDGAAAAKL
ncbi:patatin-like phospholipase family protein [Roseiarcus sp.]|uniref:patatin-like phospholipase family protein n=1 Tax=Roseiarcus sp. TaxID=1969460 RepID=UPI003F9DA041